jgi:hypothetical protein
LPPPSSHHLCLHRHHHLCHHPHLACSTCGMVCRPWVSETPPNRSHELDHPPHGACTSAGDNEGRVDIRTSYACPFLEHILSFSHADNNFYHALTSSSKVVPQVAYSTSPCNL